MLFFSGKYPEINFRKSRDIWIPKSHPSKSSGMALRVTSTPSSRSRVYSLRNIFSFSFSALLQKVCFFFSEKYPETLQKYIFLEKIKKFGHPNFIYFFSAHLQKVFHPSWATSIAIYLIMFVTTSIFIVRHTGNRKLFLIFYTCDVSI